MLTAVLWGAPCQAQSASRLDDPNLAARVNGAPVYALTVDALWRLGVVKDPKLTRAMVLDAIIANRLVAATAHTTFKEYDLHAARRVAFESDVMLDDQLVAHLRTLYGNDIDMALKALPGGSLNGLVKEQGTLDAAAMDPVFGSAGRLLLEYSLSPEQQGAARRLVLLRTRLPSAATITLWDVYRRQNVQGRVELFGRNVEFIRQQAQLKLASAFVLDWARQRFGAAALDDFRLALADQEDVRGLMALHGIDNDVDAESKLINHLAQQVSAAEVGAYYRAHKDEFKRIVRVKARHIRLGDEAIAKEVGAAAAKGADFSTLARQHSSASDAKSGGDLGWIVHEGKLSWLSELAFIQDEGKVSSPFRAAVAPNEPAYWEIVLVEKREEGYQAPNSEAVRYVASGSIAHEKALQQFTSMRERLLRAAKIEVNRKALDPAPVASIKDKA
jgi:parvulin-like peptidyl-prolyl isomerase